MIKVRVHGIDDTIREMIKENDRMKIGARRGVKMAAKHLMEKIMSKFGSYQKTGGEGNGPWKELSYASKVRKLRKWGHKKPLIGSGDMMNSFHLETRGRGGLTASVYSNSEALVHHIYGAPRAGVPKRDPMLVTVDEEENKCHMIITDEIYKEMR